MFEQFNFHALYIAIQAVLTLYAQGLDYVNNIYSHFPSRCFVHQQEIFKGC